MSIVDTHVAGFRQLVSTSNRHGPGASKYEVLAEYLMSFKLLGFIWNAIADSPEMAVCLEDGS